MAIAPPAASEIELTASSYNALPYESLPIPATHPARLAANATMFGLDPPAVATARVLELGCAAGGNLIPMAFFHPEARFLGVDLSERQIEDGKLRLVETGLDNIELRQASITELGEDIGMFDYILCHGVYSWVPQAVRDKILEICGQHLTPTGIACISYNVLPGWRLLQPIRDAFRLMIPESSDAVDRAASARKLLQYISQMVPEERDYSTKLKDLADRFKKYGDHYLFHEFMSEVNEPVAFNDFVGGAACQGLVYLGESDIDLMMAENLGAEFADKLNRTTTDIHAFEQMLDILSGRTFRSTLLVRQAQQAKIDRKITIERLAGLHFIASHRLSMERRGEQAILTGEDFDTSTFDDPIEVALIERLFHGLPVSISHGQCAQDFDEAAFPVMAKTLAWLIMSGAVKVVSAPIFASKLSKNPCVYWLARSDAAAGRTRTANQRHLGVALEGLPNFLVRQLDGTVDRAELESRVLDAYAAGEITALAPDGEAIDQGKLPGLVHNLVGKQLEFLAASGLFES